MPSKLRESKTQSPLLHDAFAGAVSGLLIGITLQPLEIIKVCQIVNPMRLATIENARFTTSFYTSIRLIYRLEGLKGFWRGLSPALLKMVTGSAVYFQILQDMTRYSTKSGFVGAQADFVTSGSARMLSAIVCNPLNVIRTRFEVVGFNEYSNLWDAFRKIYAKEGYRGFMKGSLTCMLRDGPFAGVYFAILNLTKTELKPLKLSNPVSTMTAGLFAGVIATTLTQPFEVLRTKIQVSQERKMNVDYKFGGISSKLLEIYSKDGINGLTKGLVPRLMRKPLSNALTFTLFESFTGQSSHALIK